MEEAEKGSGLRATVDDLRQELERAREQLKTMVCAAPNHVSGRSCGAVVPLLPGEIPLCWANPFWETEISCLGKPRKPNLSCLVRSAPSPPRPTAQWAAPFSRAQERDVLARAGAAVSGGDGARGAAGRQRQAHCRPLRSLHGRPPAHRSQVGACPCGRGSHAGCARRGQGPDGVFHARLLPDVVFEEKGACAVEEICFSSLGLEINPARFGGIDGDIDELEEAVTDRERLGRWLRVSWTRPRRSCRKSRKSSMA